MGALFLRATPGSGGVSAEGKRKPKQEADEDYGEFPQKKHKLYGKGGTSLFIFPQATGLYSLRMKGMEMLAWALAWLIWKEGMGSMLP